MTRNHRSAKAAGTRFENVIVDYLAKHVDDRIERRNKGGMRDRGDVSGLRHSGGRVVVECKNWAHINLAGWAAQAEAERLNDNAIAAMVAHKRHGNNNPGDQWVTLTLRDLVALLTGGRPE